MIIENATILRIDPPAVPIPGGGTTQAEGAATVIRCCWQDPKSGRKWILGAGVEDATAVLYLDGNRGSLFGLEGRVLLRVDGEPGDRLYTVLQLSPQVGMGLDNTEVYLKG